MADSIEIEIVIDESDLEEAQQNIEEYENTSNKIIEQVDTTSKASFQEVLGRAKGAYLIGLGMVRMLGGSVTYMFRSMVSTAFATIAALKAIALGKAMTTGDWLSFGLEMGQLGLAIGATVAAELQAQDIAKGLMGAKMSLMGLQQYIGFVSTM